MTKKNKGQFFTPEWVVNLMLDLSGFNSNNSKIIDMKIIDNSCGDGAFLIEIVKRIIFKSKNMNLSNEKISSILENNIYGIELDSIAFNNCYKNLEGIRRNNNLPKIKWKIFNENTLKIFSKFINKFDLVIGNPPYVRIHNTVEDLKKFSFCKSGMTDLYIAFYEIGIKMLKPTGKLCYINPSSIFNSKAALFLRNYILENKLLRTVIDFKHKQLFEKITTYTSIILLDNQKSENMSFSSDLKKFYELNYSDLNIKGSWYFSSKENLIWLKKILESENKITVKNGIATLADKFFLNQFFQNLKSKYVVDVLKASTLKQSKIFFPYDSNFKIKQFEEFEEKIQKFLIENKNILLKRDLENKDIWWGFGRTQSIKDLDKIKVSVNTTIKTINSIKTKVIKNGLILSGLYVIAENIDQANKIEKIVNSKHFINYISILSKYKSGGYYTFNSTELNKFISFYLE